MFLLAFFVAIEYEVNWTAENVHYFIIVALFDVKFVGMQQW